MSPPEPDLIPSIFLSLRPLSNDHGICSLPEDFGPERRPVDPDHINQIPLAIVECQQLVGLVDLDLRQVIHGFTTVIVSLVDGHRPTGKFVPGSRMFDIGKKFPAIGGDIAGFMVEGDDPETGRPFLSLDITVVP